MCQPGPQRRLHVRIHHLAGHRHLRREDLVVTRIDDVEGLAVFAAIGNVGGGATAAGLHAVQRLAALAEHPHIAHARMGDDDIAGLVQRARL